MHMETVMKADIFFFVAAIGFGVLFIIGSVALWYIVGILRNVKRATDTIGAHIEHAGERLDAMSEAVAESGIFNAIFGKKRKRSGTTHKGSH